MILNQVVKKKLKKGNFVLAKHVQWSREWSKGRQGKGQGRANCKYIFNITDCKFQSWDAYQAHLIRLAHPNQFGKLPLPSPQCAFYLLQILPPHCHWWRRALNYQSCLYALFLPGFIPDMRWNICYVKCVFHKIHLHRFRFGAIQIWASPILSLCDSTKLHFLHKIDQFARKRWKKAISTI